MKDIIGWSRKVKPGGIISGHDYVRRKGQDEFYAVVQAVNDYCEAAGIKTLNVCRGEDVPSWWFVK
jgi:hypothetical protein